MYSGRSANSSMVRRYPPVPSCSLRITASRDADITEIDDASNDPAAVE